MKSYILKLSNGRKEDLEEKIKSMGGVIEYSSPVLPILSAQLSEGMIGDLQCNFALAYINETPKDGQLQEIKGSLQGATTPAVTIIPNINHSLLRARNLVGWGTTVAVLDSGIDEEWVIEELDFTGFGVMPNVDHGTKVANIIRLFAPGAKMRSFKVAQDENVKYNDVMIAVDEAVKKSDVINLSLGFAVEHCTESQPCPLCETINYYTVNENKLFVAAAGNIGKENSISCPGKSQETVTVGSIDENELILANYSSIGVPGIKKPNILTSGTILYSKGLPHIARGTSFSTPVVTGIVSAFFNAVNKNIPATKSYLYSTAKDLGLPEHHQGFGLLDLDFLLEEMQNDKSTTQGEKQTPN